MEINNNLNKLDLLIVFAAIGLLAATGYYYFQNQQLRSETATLQAELKTKPTQTCNNEKAAEIIRENNDWQLLSVKDSDFDLARGLYIINKKDSNKLKILGTTDPWLFKYSAVFLDKADSILFIQTRLDEEKRLYPQKEKLIFYSISQNKVYKEIPKERFLELLNKEDRDFASKNSNLANLKLSSDNKLAALNLTNLTEPNGWLFIINLQNGKIKSGPSGLVDYKWKDNNIIEYEVRSSNQVDENNIPYFEKKIYTIDN